MTGPHKRIVQYVLRRGSTLRIVEIEDDKLGLNLNIEDRYKVDSVPGLELSQLLFKLALLHQPVKFWLNK